MNLDCSQCIIWLIIHGVDENEFEIVVKVL